MQHMERWIAFMRNQEKWKHKLYGVKTNLFHLNQLSIRISFRKMTIIVCSFIKRLTLLRFFYRYRYDFLLFFQKWIDRCSIRVIFWLVWVVFQFSALMTRIDKLNIFKICSRPAIICSSLTLNNTLVADIINKYCKHKIIRTGNDQTIRRICKIPVDLYLFIYYFIKEHVCRKTNLFVVVALHWPNRSEYDDFAYATEKHIE